MDKETFTRLVTAQQRSLYRVAVSYTASSADAEDAVQNALLRAWQKRHSLREEAYFATWLTRILINECKSLLRKRRSTLPLEGALLPIQPPVDEQALLLREALFALPEKQRVPLILHAVEGYTFHDIAAMLALPTGTVKTRVARAQKKLKQEADDHAE